MLALIGTIGIIAIEASYLPQIARIARLKHADDVSVFFPALNFAGRVFAMTYAMSTGQQVFTWGFAFGCLLRLTLLAQVIYYRDLRPRGFSLMSSGVSNIVR